MSSLVSAKGPSTTAVRLPLEYLMRAPLELGCRPLRSSSTPAFISSSLYLAMELRSDSLGITPASDSLLAFTIIMNFMLVSFRCLLQSLCCKRGAICGPTDSSFELAEVDKWSESSKRLAALSDPDCGVDQRPEYQELESAQ